MQKRWVKIAGIVAAVLVLVIILVPFFVNADTFRPAIQNQLSSSIGRSVTLGHLSLSILSGSLVANDISIADDPKFSTNPFIQAKKLLIGVEMGPLIFHRELRITNFTVDTPAIQLISNQNGTWNFSSIGGAANKSEPQQSSAIPDLTVGELKIKSGSATVSSIPATGKPFVYTDIELAVKQLDFEKSFPFQLSATLPGGGSLKLDGNAGPLAQKNAADTPFNATIDLKHFDPVAGGVIDASKGISGVIDINAQLASDGTNLTSTGKIQATRLHLARTGSPAPKPVNIDYAISSNLNTRTGTVRDLSIHAGTAAAHVTGGFRSTAQAIMLDLRASAPDLPVDQLEELLPAVGVTLPSGSSLHGGTLTATLTISGPATDPTIAGPVELDNSTLAGFDLGSKIQGLNPFGGTGGGTKIQTLRTTVNSGPHGTQFSNIYGDLPQIGTATGSGTVSPTEDLNFNLVAKLTSSNAVGAAANQVMNQVSGLVGSFLHPKAAPSTNANSNAGIPLTITGTAKSPTIRANLRAMLR